MKSSYKKLGKYIRLIKTRNKDLQIKKLIGLSTSKKFIPSIANTIGTNMRTYRVIKKNQFAYCPVTSRNSDKITVSLNLEHDIAILSQAYPVFEVINPNELHPEYLMMWFRRPEFDRYARFKSHGSARETFSWEEMCDVELPIPSIEKQRAIVQEYNTVINRIKLNEQLSQKLEETAQALYRHWFVDFEFPNENGQPYKSSGGKMVWNEELAKEIPDGWQNGILADIAKTQYGFTTSATVENIGPKFLRITDIANSHINWKNVPYCKISEKELEKYLLKNGDVLVARTGATVGVAKRINKHHPNAIFASYLVRLTPIEFQNNIFLGLTVVSGEYRKYILSVAGGSAQPQANATLMCKYKIIKPFENLNTKLNKFCEPIYDQMELLQSENSKLEKIKRLLLSRVTFFEKSLI